MNGTNATTGKRLGGIAHLRQSLLDILTTPLGSRVMRRDYGSKLFQLIDAPLNRRTMVELYAATAEAIARWEPRFKLTRVQAVSAKPGEVELDLSGQYLPTGEQVAIDGLVVR